MVSPDATGVSAWRLLGTISPFFSTAMRLPSSASSRIKSATVVWSTAIWRSAPFNVIASTAGRWIDVKRKKYSTPPQTRSVLETGLFLVTAHRLTQQAKLLLQSLARIAPRQMQPDTHPLSQRKLAILQLRDEAARVLA